LPCPSHSNIHGGYKGRDSVAYGCYKAKGVCGAVTINNSAFTRGSGRRPSGVHQPPKRQAVQPVAEASHHQGAVEWNDAIGLGECTVQPTQPG
jgi:hypothetical protein